MDITVSSRNIELTEALRSTTEEKIGRLSRFLEGIERAEVHFFEEKNPRIAEKDICEVTVEGHGHHLRAKVAAGDPYAAVDGVVAKLEHQLHKVKTKLVTRSHSRPREAVLAGEPDFLDLALANTNHLSDVTEDERDTANTHQSTVSSQGSVIVKVKSFAMEPMTPDEAAEKMELLGHGFYFFSNSATDRAAVVYVRHDGNVGLIDEAG
ncbi:MAG: ribosome hibernation-promoting factor, HPF/YfiA family [Acidimicrobiales bacterium]